LRPTISMVYLTLSGTGVKHARNTCDDLHDVLGTVQTLSTSSREQVTTQEPQFDGQESAVETLHRGYLPTPRETTAAIMMMCMISCNFDVPNDGFCCARHLAVKCSQEILQELSSTPCHAHWPVPTGQCSQCGAMAQEASDSCDWCGAGIETSSHAVASRFGEDNGMLPPSVGP